MQQPKRDTSGVIKLPLPLLRREYGVLLCSWSTWCGMRAAGQLDLPGLTGAWAWAAFVILLVDSQNISLEKLKSWRVGAVAALAIVPATLIDFGREALFRWTDLVLAPVSGASGPTNWFLTVTLAALANAVGRMLVELGPPEEGAGETVRRAFFRALPFAVLLAIAVKSQVSRL